MNNLLGRNMISTTLNNNEKLDVSMLNNGVYLIEIIAKGNKTIKKFVKQ
ncbi:MAG: T9SS type A sorting domain-containing protein [Bacteroidia bacterium]